MGRFFNNRAECDELVDQATDPDNSVEEQLAIIGGSAGEAFGALLALRNAVKVLEHSFGGRTGVEVHDINALTRMREPLAQLHLAIEGMIDGAKDVTWSAEICTCERCRHEDMTRAAKYN